MISSLIVFTLFYTLLALCFIFRTDEFISAGLTIEYIFHKFLGSEHEHFIMFHIRRTSVTLLVHSLLPVGYVIGLKSTSDSWIEPVIWEAGIYWTTFLFFSVLLPLASLTAIAVWSQDGWSKHPIARTLQLFCAQNTYWTTLSSDIDVEFRRVDKVSLQCGSLTSILATDNWIIKLNPYSVQFAHQSDSTLVVSSADTHPIATSGTGSVQFLNIEVKPTRAGTVAFNIRLNALDFKDLQDKVRRPIAILQMIKFHQTRTEQFLEVFRNQVAQNPVHMPTQDVELCIGCMVARSSVKLVKYCGDESTTDRACTNCYCRPMWCTDCMGKWFMSRQEPTSPESWMSSKCTCPVCRSIFCVLDVCHITPSPS